MPAGETSQAFLLYPEFRSETDFSTGGQDERDSLEWLLKAMDSPSVFSAFSVVNSAGFGFSRMDHNPKGGSLGGNATENGPEG